MSVTLGRMPTPRRERAPLLLSVVLHVVAIVALAAILAVPGGMSRFWRPSFEVPKAERVQYIQLAPVRAAPAAAADVPARTAPAPRPAAPLVAPTKAPDALPPVDAMPSGAAIAPGGTGSGLGVANGVRGVVPDMSDPRLWQDPGQLPAAERTNLQIIDSAIAARVAAGVDSMAEAQRQAQPPSWVVERDGKKYGLDQQKIYLGKFSIPSALLALLPINVQANPIAADREHFISQQRTDIVYHARRAMNEDEFREAVKKIRERKERERKRALEQGKVIAAP